ncbi:MAG TPA: L-ribulose-5-phosphate 4-epimerase AraD [Terrimicrobiaceae bacterium]|nr:L-ribulose-5-phosphate 4-epimerase AraD [Terrimicrobiaceae bacterium]
MNFGAIQEECFAANTDLPRRGLIDLTFGNASVLDRAAGVFAIKPSGVPYADLSVNDIVVLDLEGRVVHGKLRPSSDAPTHRRLFLAFSGIRSVVHTHSRNAVAFAQAGMPVPCLGTTHADYFHGDIPVTRSLTPEEIQGDYEWETGNVIVESFQTIDPEAVPAVLVRGHGPFTWGTTGALAVEHAAALEIIAEMARHALQLQPGQPSIPQVLLDRHYLRKHGPAAYYGQ